jgi:hypothetical protein
MAVKSKFPFFRRKGKKGAEEEGGLEDLPQHPQPTMPKPERPVGSDKGEPKGAKGAKGTAHGEAEAGLSSFLKKRKGEMLRKGR